MAKSNGRIDCLAVTPNASGKGHVLQAQIGGKVYVKPLSARECLAMIEDLSRLMRLDGE